MILHPTLDDMHTYETDQTKMKGRTIVTLKRKPNGDCHYLGEAGCTIHERAPFVCKSFDCRVWVLKLKAMPQHDLRALQRQGLDLGADVVAAGKARLMTLKPGDTEI